MGDEKRDLMLETDLARICDLREAGRIRREFMCQAAARLYSDSHRVHTVENAWSDAEALLLEGQRRGVLP